MYSRIDYLRAVDAGEIKNVPAPEFAIRYYRMAETATLRDVILHVRADECMVSSYIFQYLAVTSGN